MSVLAAAGLAACGGGGSGGDTNGGSGAAAVDPATRVPQSAVLYASASVKPGASTSKALKSIVDTFGGKGTFQRLLGQVEDAHNSKVSFAKDIKPWLGDRVGIAFTKWPANFNGNTAAQNLVVIFPTANPSAAKKALPDLKRGLGDDGTTAEVSGNFLYAGSRSAISAAEAVKSGNSLASSSAYKASLKKVHSNPLATAYIRPKSLVPLLTQAMENSSATSSIGGVSTSSSPTGAAIAKTFAKLSANSNALASLAVTSKTITLDFAASGIQNPSSNTTFPDVGSLPGDSWLAIATPGISEAEINRELSSAMQAAATGGPAATRQARAITRVISRLFPHGIQGIEASAAGPITDQNPPKVGLSLDLGSAQTAQQSTAMLFNYLGAGGANVPGNQSAFSIPIDSSNSFNVTSAGSDVVATLGYPNAAAFTSPASKLSDNSTYKQAVAQLPSGSEVPLYINLGELASDLPPSAFTGQSGRQAQSVLQKFSYAIVGVNASTAQARIVVGLS